MNLTELTRVVDLQHEVQVTGKKGESDDPDAVESFGSREGADDDRIQGWPWAQQHPAVDAPAGHIDEGTLLGYESESASHILYKTEKPPLILQLSAFLAKLAASA